MPQQISKACFADCTIQARNAWKLQEDRSFTTEISNPHKQKSVDDEQERSLNPFISRGPG
jgi:hypothetical protein